MRGNLFQINGNEKKPMVLPEAVGVAVNLSEKVYVPVKEYPDVISTNEPITVVFPARLIMSCFSLTLSVAFWGLAV